MEQKVVFICLEIEELKKIIESSVSVALENRPESNQIAPHVDIIPISEASKILNLAIPTIYGLVSSSLIPSMKKGKRLYFSKTELEAWIKSGRKVLSTPLQDRKSLLKPNDPRKRKK